MTGFGYQIGGARPDMGDGFVELQCDNLECNPRATWVGPIGEECAYCAPDAAERRWAASHRWHLLGEELIAEQERRMREALAKFAEVGL